MEDTTQDLGRVFVPRKAPTFETLLAENSRLSRQLELALEDLWVVKNGLMNMRDWVGLRPSREEWIAAKLVDLQERAAKPVSDSGH
jgi:hypothetical protein